MVEQTKKLNFLSENYPNNHIRRFQGPVPSVCGLNKISFEDNYEKRKLINAANELKTHRYVIINLICIKRVIILI